MFTWWRRRRSLLRVSCPECGDINVTAQQVRLFVCKEDRQHQLSFPCGRGRDGRNWSYVDERALLQKLERLAVTAHEWSVHDLVPSDLAPALAEYQPTHIDLTHPLSHRHRQVFARQVRFVDWFDRLNTGQYGKL